MYAHHHIVVATSPLYLLGLEAVIHRSVNNPLITTCRTIDDLSSKLNSAPRGLLWWAIQSATHVELRRIVIPHLQRFPEIRIVLLQHSYDSRTVKELFELGISGFLSDVCTADEVHKAIMVISSGKRYLDLHVANTLSSDYLNIDENTEKPNDPLTDRERQVLGLIVEEYTTREIAEKLYISKCTVETHRLHLIRKLKVKNTAGLVREALTHSLCRTSV